MTAIELRFLTGKWHATPWGRQVNEGAVEWPPSPWRLLRSLVAVWHHKHHEVADGEFQSLFEALITPPSYRLPKASQGHTRHYMPGANDEKAKVFDTFVSVPANEALVVAWPDVTLSDAQRGLLGRLLASMSYFGRAESWIDARLLDHWEGTLNAIPRDENGVDGDRELVRTLGLMLVGDYGSWRENRLQELGEKVKAQKKGTATEKKKITKSEIAAIERTLPPSLLDAVRTETTVLHTAGWNQPPGSRWVDYVREGSAFAERSSVATRIKPDLPTIARYAVAGAVRPLLTDAIWIGERARGIVMGCSKKINGENSSEVFSGKHPDGTRKRDTDEAHRHAHYLCEANESTIPGNHGRITHLTIYAPGGFRPEDELALSRFNTISERLTKERQRRGHGGHDLQFVLLGLGVPGDFGGLKERAGESPILASSKVWKSRTPFVPTDHLHIRGDAKSDPNLRESATQRELERIIRKELSRRKQLKQFSTCVKVAPLPCTEFGSQQVAWLKFRRERQDGDGKKSTSQGFGFTLTFPEEVQGPIVLGYGCHFGLGQFVPADRNAQ